MSFMDSISQKWEAFTEKTAPTFEKIGAFFRKVGAAVKKAWDFTVKFKQFILAIPVALGAVILAIRNVSVLPKRVGCGLQLDGTFDFMVVRGSAGSDCCNRALSVADVLLQAGADPLACQYVQPGTADTDLDHQLLSCIISSGKSFDFPDFILPFSNKK